MSKRVSGLRTDVAGCWATVMGVLILIAGCNSGQPNGGSSVLERISRVGRSAVAPKVGVLAEKGRASITTECAKQSYETARKGLIVSETGLHEDVFVLRDRLSYQGIGYGLDEAQRLEDLLRAEAKAGGHPEAQSDCIQEFAEHLETLSDPLVEADERQKELDVSAFEDASKAAQGQAEKKLREADKLAVPRMESPELLNKNY